VELRDTFIDLCSRDTTTLFEWSKKLCGGSRQQWEPQVKRLLGVLEELLADIVFVASERADRMLHVDQLEQVQQWSYRVGPVGVYRCQQAIDDARHDLARNVSGRLVVEALVSHFQSAFKSL
jgi:hypothetical protein